MLATLKNGITRWVVTEFISQLKIIKNLVTLYYKLYPKYYDAILFPTIYIYFDYSDSRIISFNYYLYIFHTLR